VDDSKLSGARLDPALLAEYVRVLHDGGVARARIGDIEIEFSREAATPAAKGDATVRPRPSGYEALLPNRPSFPRVRS
jgi:hypothetical protein